MDNIQHFRALIAAVETGSLSAAARKIDVTQSAVSQNLATLETDIGAPLLIRSRNGVRVTEAGQIVYDHAKRLLETLRDMETALDAAKEEVSGRLRVTASLLVSQTQMSRVITRLRRTHPELHIQLIASDEMVDFEKDSIDIALRFGSPGDGQGIVRRIGSLSGALIATPAYLDEAGRPKGPEDLKNLSYIQYREDPEETEMSLTSADGTQVVEVTQSFSAQHPSLVLHATESGLGFAKAPLFYIANCLKRGVFEEVLPGYQPTPKPVYLIQAEHVRNTPKALVFRTTLLEELAGLEGVKLTPDLVPPSIPDRTLEMAAPARKTG